MSQNNSPYEVSESFTGSVIWLSDRATPTQVLTHLRARGLALVRSAECQVHPPARLSLIETGLAGGNAHRITLSGRRVAVLHPDPGRADRLAQALREKGGDVIVLALNPTLLDSVETFDPDAVLVEPEDFYGSCWEMVRALWTHPRLRWTPILLTPSEPFGLGPGSVPNTAAICAAVHELSAASDAISAQVERRETFEVGLHELGPARMLRALLAPVLSVRARVETEDFTIEIDLAEHIIVGARGGTGRVIDDSLLGPHALAKLLTEARGRVHVQPVQSPAVTNVMAPLDSALHSARVSLAAPAPRVSAVATVVGQSVPLQIVAVQNVAVQSRPEGDPSPAADTPRPRLMPLPPAAAPITRRSSVSSSKSPNKTVLGLPALGIPKASASDAKPPEVVAELSVRTDVAETPRVAALVAAAPPDPASADAQAVGYAKTERIVLEQATALQASLSSAACFPSPFHEDEEVDIKSFVHTLPGGLRLGTSKLRAALALGGALALLLTFWGWPRSENTEVHAAGASAAEASHEKSTAASPQSPLAAAPGNGAATPSVSAGASAGSLAVPPDEDELDEDGDDASRPASVRRASELVSQGHAFRRKGLLGTARTRYLEALDAHAGYPRAYAGLTQVALARKDKADAVRFAKKLVHARPNVAVNHLLLGDAHALAGSMSAAKAEWRIAANKGSKAARERLTS